MFILNILFLFVVDQCINEDGVGINTDRLKTIERGNEHLEKHCPTGNFL
jgi:hypothetical protein